MYNQRQMFIGIVIVLIGIMFLIGSIFNVDAGRICWPAAMILAGVLLLVRPHLLNPDTPGRIKLIGNVRRHGEWQVTDDELWIGIGDVRLNMIDADIPVGETQINIYSFVGDVRVSVPKGVGILASSTAFVTDAKVLGHKGDYFVTPFEMSSDDYEAAERKVRVEMMGFVSNLKIKQVQVEEADADFSEPQESPDEIPLE